MENLVRVVAISNQNVQMVMQKLEQFQSEMSRILSQFHSRISAMEEVVN